MNHTGSIQLFLDTCHLIHAKGLVSGSGGNISLRCDDGILITLRSELESLKEE
ncbi:MAG: class II aldolase/adducin family protein [Faecalibacterium prausnitzii]